ncbi:MAG TPA: amylo-alpha-1,6-glucosidase [Coleofasciculaceae cyanobacterium]
MNELDTREWLLTNGLGSFASGTVCDARTRTYHGWLIAAIEPPGRRTLLLSHLDASIDIAGKVSALSTNFWDGGRKIESSGYQLLHSFNIEPVPTWSWGEDIWRLTRQLVMPHGLSGDGAWQAESQLCDRILIHYRYEGTQRATLRLRPLIADRDFHHQQLADEELQFSQLIEPNYVYLQSLRAGKAGIPWQLRWSQGIYLPEGVWYWNYFYPEEYRRGLGDREDLYSPGYLTVILQPGEGLTLEARVGARTAMLPPLTSQLFEQTLQAELNRQKRLLSLSSVVPKPDRENVWRQLLQAGDRFIAYRASIDGPTVIAGYPWFNDWGRDTLIAIPGLALATGRFALAKGLLETFGSYCRDGLIPNTFPDAGSEPIYNSIDAVLWWIETLGLYVEATQDWSFLIRQYPVVRKIYKALMAGTIYNIGVDATDGLLTWEAPHVALTWMDVVIDGQPVTPRQGKPVEINGLWYSALCWIVQWTEKLVEHSSSNKLRLSHQAQRYSQQADKVKSSLQKFWNPERKYFYDTIEPDDRRDARIRPSAVLALSLHHCGFSEEQGRWVLKVARDRLLTPYGLRSLDPADPAYVSYYNGNPLHRDRAYHQGTVWSWLIGPFIRAWKRFYPTEPIPCQWQPWSDHIQQQACLGSVSEIFDGDSPHLPQGAIAQAWSVAELIRHFSDF